MGAGAEGREGNLWVWLASAQPPASVTKIPKTHRERKFINLQISKLFLSYLESNLKVHCPFILALKYFFTGRKEITFIFY